MKTGDVMTTGAATVTPDTPLAEALRIMVEHRISGLPVVEGGKLVGIVTEGDFLPTGANQARPFDLLRASAPGGGGLAGRKVSEIMTSDPVTVTAETSLETAAEQMTRRKIKRLPVVADGKVIGILSRADLLSALLRRA